MALITAPRNAIGRERPVISPFDQPNNCLARENAYAERKGHLRRRPGVALGSRQSPEFCVDLSGKPPHLNPCFRETTQAVDGTQKDAADRGYMPALIACRHP